MYTAKVQKESGSPLTLTGRESEWQIVHIQGLNPPSAQINLTNIVGLDGAKFNSSKLNTRNIVITIRLNGDVEGNRQYLERYFTTKETCRFFFKDANRDVFIDGIVENVECDPFTISELMQISIICPQPLFRKAQATVVNISDAEDGFYFPFSIDMDDPIVFSTYNAAGQKDLANDSDSETGLEIAVRIDASVDSLKIANLTTNELIDLEYVFLSGDEIYINTRPGEKTVTLTRDSNTISLFSALTADSVLFGLTPGTNTVNYLADNGTDNDDVQVIVSYNVQYRGI